jgi:uncharacterized protein
LKEARLNKRIRDPLYGFIRVDSDDLRLIDHKIVQRLRWVNQLPLEQLVYPSAQHSRFEHSLGTMHLAGMAAESLVRNSPERFREACANHPSFSRLDKADPARVFVRCARWSGLLHDLGHAPFSHTFEDACTFSGKESIAYDHEYYGFFLSRQVVEDIGEAASEITTTVLNVLNKNIPLSDLYPPEMLIRRIIDGPMDVDKGDYLPRDSYHCGVNYGIYDREFLWENVIITENFQVGVLPKAALEAWGLTLARHKMHQYVYQHHVRNITDALLVEILNQAFDRLENNQGLREILPLQSKDDVRRSECIVKFVHWTDNSLLKSLDAVNDSAISAKIESFSNRRLYKRGFAENLSAYVNSIGNEAEIMQRLDRLGKDMAANGIEWNLIPAKETLIPVFTKQVQLDILVQKDDREEVPLAQFLNFGVPEDDMLEKGDVYLRVFIHPSSMGHKEQIRKNIQRVLQDFNS